jgi:tetratricopeptide (TPR) repeat protein
VAAAVLALAAVTAGAIRCRRQRPYLLVGWLWYLGMLAPVIGLVQFGAQAEADRFSYLPQIGLAIALVWTAAKLGERKHLARAVAAACVLTALCVAAWCQTSYWRDSETLWTRVLACNAPSAVAHNNLGVTLKKSGRLDEAMWHYQRALDIDPDEADAHDNLANALVSRGRIAAAIGHYQSALRIKPNNARFHNNLGTVLADCGRLDEALGHLQQAVDHKPDYCEAHYNLGTVLRDCGRLDEAAAEFQQALDLQPGYADASRNLSAIRAAMGRPKR